MLDTTRSQVLIVSPSLGFGGAELATQRLILGLHSHLPLACLLMHRQRDDCTGIKELTRAGIAVHFSPMSATTWQIPRAIVRRFKLNISKIPTSLYEVLVSQHLRKLQRQNRWQLINSHQIRAERLTCLALRNENTPLVGTDHGDYRQLYTSEGHLRSDSTQIYAPLVSRSNMLICPAAANVPIAARLPWHSSFQIRHIPYGYKTPNVATQAHEPLKADSFIFGMVARGVAEKGWREAIEAFQIARLNIPRKTILRLVGDGPALKELHREHQQRQWLDVEFLGHLNDPSAIISSFDIGLLPSYFHMESLPNTIIEYVAHGIPVIATNHAGIPEILRTPKGPAGVLVNKIHSGGPANIQELADAMTSLATTPNLYAELKARTPMAARRFNIESMVTEYLNVFEYWMNPGTRTPHSITASSANLLSMKEKLPDESTEVQTSNIGISVPSLPYSSTSQLPFHKGDVHACLSKNVSLIPA